MKKILIILMAICSVSAFADTTPSDQVSSGPEVGSNDFGSNNVGGYADFQLGSANSSGLNSGVDNSGAVRFDGGYKINSYVGVEVGFTGLSSNTAGTQVAKGQYFDGSVKGFLPMSDWFDIHAQIGGAYAAMSPIAGNVQDGGSMNVLLGAGMDFYVAKSVALTVNDYNYLNLGADGAGGSSGLGNTNVVMGGIKYDFK